MRDFDKGRDGLKALKALGVAIALDDFGTGYSSLSYVHRPPLDKIKIDRSFIKDIETQPASRDIVKAVVDLCGALKLGCVIEGIETREQAKILRSLRATMMQGTISVAACRRRRCRASSATPAHRGGGRLRRRRLRHYFFFGI